MARVFLGQLAAAARMRVILHVAAAGDAARTVPWSVGSGGTARLHQLVALVCVAGVDRAKVGVGRAIADDRAVGIVLAILVLSQEALERLVGAHACRLATGVGHVYAGVGG